MLLTGYPTWRRKVFLIRYTGIAKFPEAPGIWKFHVLQELGTVH